ncbi:MAG: PHP domain-containing protein [Sphingobacteriia bacterium]|nr:PHP domain-containing protein [Sphingobacteriia bacterium]
MKIYKADLHIHTVLSPCGSLDMSPVAIVDKALEKGLDIIAITDHNTTLQAECVQKIGKQKGLMVITGVEVTSKEEVHCLAYFKEKNQISEFQEYIDQHIPNIQNNPDYFGYQIQVDENDNIVYQEERLLISAINQSVEQILKKVKTLDGIFILAHIDKSKNSIISQLGFLPPDLEVDALEVTKRGLDSGFIEQNSYLSNNLFVSNSDAHYIDDIGKSFTQYKLETLSIPELFKIIRTKQKNKIILN